MGEATNPTVRREWKVRLDLELPADAHDRITIAIQKAVLAELADIDVASAYSVSLRGPGGRGHVTRESENGTLIEEEWPTGPGGTQTDGLIAREPQTELPI